MIEKAFENRRFLHSRAARPIRILAEYLEPLSRFERYQVANTVVLLGSSRLHPPDVARARLREAEQALAADPTNPALRHRYEVARAQLELAHYYDEAVEVARRITEWNLQRPPHRRFLVCTGAGPGIMEAANRGAALAGGPSIGLGIELNNVAETANPYVSPELLFLFHYFFMRKFWFVYLAKAVILFPGGFGTLDELFEVLTLKQTGKLKKQLPVILYGRSFWERLIDWDLLTAHGLIDPGDRGLFVYCDSPDEVTPVLFPWLESIEPDTWD
jgi:uncharacterized protein (TIGR00730 family)